MAVIDMQNVPVKTGSIYPEPFAAQMAGRRSLRLGAAGGLTQFGANLVILEPGARSSLRHWHRNEDEFVMVVQGECTLMQDAGATVLRPGDCAAFPAGDADGHCLVNDTGAEARFLVIGTKAREEVVTYCDVDLRLERVQGAVTFTRRDGSALDIPD